MQGQANHRNALARRANRKTRTYVMALVGRWSKLRAPYSPGMHPGAEELLHRLLGIKPSYARDLVLDRRPLPSHHARRLADDLERELGDVFTLIGDLRRYADERDRTLGLHLPQNVKSMLATKARKRGD